MKANRKVMLGAALVVAIVALAGVGYAVATGYSATTSTSQNSVGSSEFILIKANDAAYTDTTSYKYGFDTTTSWNESLKLTFGKIWNLNTDPASEVTEYKYVDDTNHAIQSASFAAATHKAVAVRTVNVTVDLTNAGGNGADLTVSITGLPDTNTTTIKYFLSYRVGDGDETLFTLTSNEFTLPNTLTATTNVVEFNVYLGVPVGAIPYGTPTTNAAFTITMGFVAAGVKSA